MTLQCDDTLPKIWASRSEPEASSGILSLSSTTTMSSLYLNLETPPLERLSPSGLSFRDLPHSIDTSAMAEFQHSQAGSPVSALSVSHPYISEPNSSYTSDDNEATGFLSSAPRLQGPAALSGANGFRRQHFLTHRGVSRQLSFIN
jgi:hypothetical protein